MFGPIRAVAIDDQPSHLLAITTGLTAIGIPCTGYWWDREANELRPAPPQGGLPFVRLIFMDLNLAEQAGLPDASSLASVVIEALKQLVSPQSGPYLLVFWTLIGTRVQEVRTIIYERLELVAKVPAPLAIAELPKAPLLVSEPSQQNFREALVEFYTTLHSSIAALQTAVRDVVGFDSTLSALSSWESRAAHAGASAVNQVYECAKGDSGQPEVRSNSLQKVMAKVAVAAAGKAAAEGNPARALDAGMVDILNDQFGSSVDEESYQAVISKALGSSITSDIAFHDELSLASALNTFFHVDDDTTFAKAGDRGVVITTNGHKRDLGFKPVDHLAEFLIPSEAFGSSRQAEMRALYEAYSRSPDFVLIELGADCDHAQDKPRTRRYLLGIEVPVMFAELLKFPDNSKLRSEALQLLGPWRLEGKIKWLLVSCRRFWVWQDRTPNQNFVVRYRLRASVVNKLLHYYATFHSRPGIVEFQGYPQKHAFVYFAYGANMLTARLRDSSPSATFVRKGYIEGHQLTFGKCEGDDSGRCSIHPGQPEDRVHGVLFVVDVADRTALDDQEGYRSGDERTFMTVITAQGPCDAELYRCPSDDRVHPFDWYRDVMVAGAVEHGLPREYVDKLKALDVQVDQDASRSEASRKFLPAVKKPRTGKASEKTENEQAGAASGE